MFRLGIGDEKGEPYTPQSTKTLFPTAANQMSFGQREMPIVGHWPRKSRMPGRYDRSVCGRLGGTAGLPPPFYGAGPPTHR